MQSIILCFFVAVGARDEMTVGFNDHHPLYRGVNAATNLDRDQYSCSLFSTSNTPRSPFLMNIPMMCAPTSCNIANKTNIWISKADMLVLATTFHPLLNDVQIGLTPSPLIRAASHALSICNGQLRTCVQGISSPTLSGSPPLGSSSNRRTVIKSYTWWY